MQSIFVLLLQCTFCFSSSLKLSTTNMRRSFMVMRSIVPDKGVQSAWQLARRSDVRMPCVILVCPHVDGNVGSVSRCMLNWGLSELRIVDPKCDILSETARTFAVGSVELLENAKIFATLEDCVKDLQRVYATTARNRDMNQIMHTPSTASVEAIELLNINAEPVGEGEFVGPTVGVVFGRERSGLTNEELSLADSTIYIPANENYSVLNLAQAVNIIGYELFKRKLEVVDKVRDGGVLSLRTSDRLANREELDRFLSRLREHLLSRGYKAVSKNNDEKSGMRDVKMPKQKKVDEIFEVAVSALEDEGSLRDDENEMQVEGKWMSSTEIRNETNGEDYYRELKFRALQTIFRRSGVTKAEVDTLQGMLSTLIRPPGGR